MNELWNNALSQIRPRLSHENFETWFGPLAFDGLKDRTLALRAPNRFHADWVTTHYLALVLAAVQEQSGLPSVQVRWTMDDALQSRLPAPAKPAPTAVTPKVASLVASKEKEATAGKPNANPELNPKYVFDSFVVGPSNQLAHAASIAAASSPGQRFNPLFICGGVGLGKTHLVNAIGHSVLRERPEARILYVSAERFTNEFIWALQNQRINQFRERYRKECDVLLMDDIQFLAGRVQTQEEFFHTFNALYHSDKQIVVTSDVYPQQISEMQERLISRFQWGMVADIQAPELDTRIAILLKKALQEGITLSDEVALYVAQLVQNNVRELEGTLLRLAVKADLLKRPIQLEFVKESLGPMRSRVENQVSIEEIQKAVSEHFNLKVSDLKSHRRTRSITMPRMIAMYLCRQKLGASYPELGDRFGGKDHTTVLSAVRKVSALLEEDAPAVRSSVQTLERKLGF